MAIFKSYVANNQRVHFLTFYLTVLLTYALAFYLTFYRPFQWLEMCRIMNILPRWLVVWNLDGSRRLNVTRAANWDKLVVWNISYFSIYRE